MQDLKAYWQQVKAQRDKLPAGDAIYIVSLEGGVLVEAGRETAARALAAGTHRQATDVEIEKYKADQKNARDVVLKEEHDRKQLYALPPALEALVEAVTKKQGK